MANNIDDKALVIFAAVALCVISIWADKSVINSALSGLFGLAVGRGIAR